MTDAFLRCAANFPAEQGRYRTLKEGLLPLQPVITGRRVLDFGCSVGLSVFALIEMGASEVQGVEIELERVQKARQYLKDAGYENRATIHHVQDTRHLDFPDGAFQAVLANAVFEHV